MSQRGVWQLRKLTVSYCNWGGSSRGIRAFMESQLQAFKQSNPQLEVVTELNRGQHPFLKGSYKNKNERVVSVMNMTQEDVVLCTQPDLEIHLEERWRSSRPDMSPNTPVYKEHGQQTCTSEPH